MSLRLQSALAQQLRLTTTATYALVGARSFWSVPAQGAEYPYVLLRKSGHRPQMDGLAYRRTPATMDIEVVAYGKTQESASNVAQAVCDDLILLARCAVPITSPATSGAPWVSAVIPGTEEDLVSDEMRSLGIFAEARTYSVDYDYR